MGLLMEMAYFWKSRGWACRSCYSGFEEGREDNAQLTEDIELILDEADRAVKETDARYTHEEVFARVRRSISRK